MNKTSFSHVLAHFGMERLHPSYLGMALVCCWDYCMQRLPCGEALGSPYQIAQYLGLAIGCFLIAAVARFGKRESVSDAQHARWAAPAIGAALSFALVVPSPIWNIPWLVLALSLACGICSGLIYVLWGTFYGRISIKPALFLLFCSVIVASILKAVLSFVTAPVATAAIYALMPPLCVFSLAKGTSHLPASVSAMPKRYSKENVGIFKTLALAAALFSMAIGLLFGINAEMFALSPSYQVLTHFIAIAICVAIIWVAFARPELIESSRLWLVALLVIATGLVAVEVLGGAAQQASSAILAAGQRFIALFIWISLADIAYEGAFGTDVVFGIGKGIYGFSVACGGALAHVIAFSFGDGRISLIIIYVLMVSLLLFSFDSMPQHLKLFIGLCPPVSNPQESALEKRVATLGEKYGLSTREQEIVCLYAQGRNRSYIASQLFISDNTVRDHLKNVYKKMHIHSKQNLIDAIEKQA